MVKIDVEFWGVLANKAGKLKETIVLDRANMDLKVVIEKICQGYGSDFKYVRDVLVNSSITW